MQTTKIVKCVFIQNVKMYSAKQTIRTRNGQLKTTASECLLDKHFIGAKLTCEMLLEIQYISSGSFRICSCTLKVSMAIIDTSMLCLFLKLYNYVHVHVHLHVYPLFCTEKTIKR